jgi:Activator of Hsp90 ATPase homolog 1-like protein
MSTTTAGTEPATLVISEEIQVDASLDATFASLLAQIGRQNETPDGKPLPMVLEPRPGGRWYRELGGDNGHLWGFVQSIKRPVLLEIWGPLFISTGAVSNLTYRLSESDGGTRLAFRHTLVGPVPDEYRAHMATGWAAIQQRVKTAAEAAER